MDVYPKIVDFGIARATVPGMDLRATAARTQTGALIGTLAYMSPEQAAGETALIDTRADVYALGVVMYELIGGRLPLDIDGCKVHEAVRTICETEPQSLSAIDRRYKGDLTTIVGKALEKDRDRRYGSAEELALEIERFLRDEPVLAHPPSATYQFRKFARRNRSLVAGAVAIAAILIAATAVSLHQARLAAQHRQLAEEHFADAHELARALLFEIDESLVNVAGALPARRMLVERGLAYLEKIGEKDIDDPQILWETAAAYVIVGDVQGDTQRPNIGDFDGALASYRKAAELLESRLDVMPEQAPTTLFLTLSKIGDQLQNRSDHAGALAAYERALDFAKRTGSRDRQATAHARIANVQRALGRSDAARHHSAEADTFALEAIAANPGDAAMRRDLAVGWFKQGMASLSQEPAIALERFQNYLEIVEELAAADPENAVYQRDVAVGAQRVGHALEALGRRDEALSHYERELFILERLARADPENYQARAGIASPCCKIGEHYLARNDLAKARVYFERYLQIARSCAAESPSDAAIQRELGVAYYKMNEWHAAHADDESVTLAERIEHAQQAADWLAQCHDHFIAMGHLNLLNRSDAGVPQLIEAELAARRESASRLSSE